MTASGNPRRVDAAHASACAAPRRNINMTRFSWSARGGFYFSGDISIAGAAQRFRPLASAPDPSGTAREHHCHAFRHRPGRQFCSVGTREPRRIAGMRLCNTREPRQIAGIRLCNTRDPREKSPKHSGRLTYAVMPSPIGLAVLPGTRKSFSNDIQAPRRAALPFSNDSLRPVCI